MRSHLTYEPEGLKTGAMITGVSLSDVCRMQALFTAVNEKNKKKIGKTEKIAAKCEFIMYNE